MSTAFEKLKCELKSKRLQLANSQASLQALSERLQEASRAYMSNVESRVLQDHDQIKTIQYQIIDERDMLNQLIGWVNSLEWAIQQLESEDCNA